MHPYRKIVVIVCCVAACLWPRESAAQRTELRGVVVDETSGHLVGAEISVIGLETGYRRTTRTDSDGTFVVPLLPPGRYLVRATLEGFNPVEKPSVELNVGDRLLVRLVLPVATLEQTVTVSAAESVPTAPMPSTVIPESMIRDLPINGRRFQDFATLSPGAQVEPKRQSISFAGQRGVNGNYLLDGADYTTPFTGGIRGGQRANFIITVPQAAIAEFQVVNAGYGPEFGRSTGGLVNAVTKHGTNTTSGLAFYQVRPRDLSARDPIFDRRPAETLTQFGGSAGGPLIPDSLFWFGAVERQDSATPRQVVFSALAGVTPSAVSREAFDFYRDIEEAFEQTNDATAVLGRIDYQRRSVTLTGRYGLSDADSLNGISTGAALSPFTSTAVSAEGVEKDRIQTSAAHVLWTVSSNTLLDLKTSYSAERRPREANAQSPSVVTTIGEYGANTFTSVNLAKDSRLQGSAVLTSTRGAHTFKTGVDLTRLTLDQTFISNPYGQFTIAGADVADALDVLSIGGDMAHRFDSRAVTYTKTIGDRSAAATDFSVFQGAAFVQDAWRVLPSLTVDLGLRWEGQWNPTPPTDNRALADAVRSATFPLGVPVDPGVIPNDLGQSMPRAGFAFETAVGGRPLVIRGHGGMFSGATPLIFIHGAMNSFRFPALASLTLQPTATQTVYQQLLAVGVDLDEYPLGSEPVIPDEVLVEAISRARGEAPNPFLGAAVEGFAEDFKNPRSVQVGLGGELLMRPGWTMSLHGLLVNANHLHRNVNLNLPVPMIRSTDLAERPNFGLRSGAARPAPSIGNLLVRESGARSRYRALVAASRLRRGRYEVSGSYTLGRLKSDDDNEGHSSGFFYDNVLALDREFGASDIDARHVVQASGTLRLPLALDLAGAYRFRSGFPINPLTGNDANEDLRSTDRAYAAPGAPFARNAFRNRAVHSLDLRLLKAFAIGARARGEVSIEAFNVLNLDNVVFAGANGSTYGLGVAPVTGRTLPPDARFMRLLVNGDYDPANRQDGSPRQFQLGLRFLF